MRKLSDIKGDEAFEVLADLIDPVTEIMSDPETKRLMTGGNKVRMIQYALKHYRSQLTTILAVLEGRDPKTYEPTLVEIPIKTIQLLNDPVLVSFFGPQAQSQEDAFSGSATASTGVPEE